jgi:hypothetical protein
MVLFGSIIGWHDKIWKLPLSCKSHSIRMAITQVLFPFFSGNIVKVIHWSANQQWHKKEMVSFQWCCSTLLLSWIKSRIWWSDDTLYHKWIIVIFVIISFINLSNQITPINCCLDNCGSHTKWRIVIVPSDVYFCHESFEEKKISGKIVEEFIW